MAKKKSKKSSAKKSKENSMSIKGSKGMAFIAIFLSIVGFLIVLLFKREDRYAMFYAKQSLVLFIAVLIVGVINAILGFVPVIGWLISLVLTIAIIGLWILALVNSLSGKTKETPIVGEFARNIKL